MRPPGRWQEPARVSFADQLEEEQAEAESQLMAEEFSEDSKTEEKAEAKPPWKEKKPFWRKGKVPRGQRPKGKSKGKGKGLKGKGKGKGKEKGQEKGQPKGKGKAKGAAQQKDWERPSRTVRVNGKRELPARLRS